MKICPKFYQASDLQTLFKHCKKHAVANNSKAIIVPHAGYSFITEISYAAYNCLDNSVKNVTIIAPALYNKIYGSISTSADFFVTPLGEVKIRSADLPVNNKIFEVETAFTQQLSFVKYFLPDASVTPVIYGCEDYNNFAKYFSDKNIVVIVSNLSRFLPERENKKLDEQTARMIERKQTEDLDNELADGAVGLCAAIKFAKGSFKRIALTNSAYVNGDTSSVVGYGSWYLSTP